MSKIIPRTVSLLLVFSLISGSLQADVFNPYRSSARCVTSLDFGFASQALNPAETWVMRPFSHAVIFYRGLGSSLRNQGNAGFNLWILAAAGGVMLGVILFRIWPLYRSYRSARAGLDQSKGTTKRKQERKAAQVDDLRRSLVRWGGIGAVIAVTGTSAARFFAPDNSLEPIQATNSEIPGVIRDAAKEAYSHILSGEWMDPSTSQAKALLPSLRDIADGKIPIQVSSTIGGLLHFDPERKTMQVNPELVSSVPRRDLPLALVHEATHRTSVQLARSVEEVQLKNQINSISDLLATPESIRVLKRGVSLVITDEIEAYTNQYVALGNIARRRGISVKQFLQESADHSVGDRAKGMWLGLMETTMPDGQFDAENMTVRIAFGPYNWNEDVRRALLQLALSEDPGLMNPALANAMAGEQWNWGLIRDDAGVRQWVITMVKNQRIFSTSSWQPPAESPFLNAHQHTGNRLTDRAA